MGLAPHAIYACHAYATGMTSVRLSVTLVDCDHTVEQKVEIGMTGEIGVLSTCMQKPIQVIVFRDPKILLREDQLVLEKCGVCTSVHPMAHITHYLKIC